MNSSKAPMTHRLHESRAHSAPLLIALVLFLTAFAAPAFAQQAQKKKVAAPHQVKQYTIEQFMDTTRITGASFSPDEKTDSLRQQQDGHLQRLHRRHDGRRATATHALDQREHLRRLLFPQRLAHPLHL